jgi:hypothetical protein
MSLSNQQGDVLLYMRDNEGQIDIENGVVSMDVGYKTMLVLSLLGGNEDDDGSESTDKNQWWGNYGEQPENHLRSSFNGVARNLPLNSANLQKLEDAARDDLERDFVDTGLFKELQIDARLLSPKRVELSGLLIANDDTILPFVFDVNKEPITSGYEPGKDNVYKDKYGAADVYKSTYGASIVLKDDIGLAPPSTATGGYGTSYGIGYI